MFEEDTSAVVVSNHGQVVKMVGDEVVFVTGRPADAAEVALRLTSPDRGGIAAQASARAQPQ